MTDAGSLVAASPALWDLLSTVNAKEPGPPAKAPGWLAEEGALKPFGRLLTPGDGARLAIFLLSDASLPMTGSLIDQDQWVIGGKD